MMNSAPDTDGGEPLTDRELDAALHELLTTATAGTHPDLHQLRSTVLSRIDPTPLTTVGSRSRPTAMQSVSDLGGRPRRLRPVVLAAVVALVVAGGLAVPTLAFTRGAATSAAAAALNEAAAAADRVAAAGGDTIPAGKYRYVEVHSWAASMGQYAYLQETRTQRWIPSDPHDMWLERRSDTGQRQWIHGSEADAPALNLPPAGVVTTQPDLAGPCQEYFYDACADKGGWSTPTKSWVDGLPTDPDELYDVLFLDTQGAGQSHEAEMLVQATEALRSALLPAGTRATLYRTMAMIPALQIVDGTANLDGDGGTAFAVDSPYIRQETIIDTATGTYIGTRLTVLVDDPINNIPVGTTIDYNAVTTSLVDMLGAVSP